MQKLIQLFVCLVVFLKVCEAQTRNFTLGSTTITTTRLQEKINDYSQCYIDVVVHNSSSFKYGLMNATVTALSGALDSDAVKYSQGLTDNNGHVCLPVLCRDEVRVFVEKNTVRISALSKSIQQKNIPMGFVVKFETNNEVIMVYAFSWGTIGGRSGPVYSAREKAKCIGALTGDYHFVFSYISVPDRLVSTLPPPVDVTDIVDPNFANAWRYGLDGAGSPKQSCFFKIKVKTLSTQAKIKASSKLKDAAGILYGVFETGPKYDVNAADYTDKAACVEFRCPAVDIMLGFEMPTFIEGSIQVPGHPNGCCVTNIRSGKIFNVGRTNFSTVTSLTSSDKYGSEKGIYINEDPRVARAKCFTGREFLGSEYAMNVSTGFAFEYNCLPSSCTLPMVGK